jgi:hypothetical protein
MAGSVSNILVGAAQIFISVGDSVSNTANYKKTMPVFGTNKAATFLSTAPQTADWRDVGFTSEGLEVSYEPTYGEVEVDQLLDSARIFKTQLRVMLRTSFNEGTFENVNTAFGQSTSAVGTSVVTGNDGSGGASTTPVASYTGSVSGTGSARVMNIQGGALGEAPVERSIVAIGAAPTTLSTDKAERVYLARRVLSMETVSHALRRNESTVYPVTFRCLPDTDFPTAEYGEVLDRVWS